MLAHWAAKVMAPDPICSHFGTYLEYLLKSVKQAPECSCVRTPAEQNVNCAKLDSHYCFCSESSVIMCGCFKSVSVQQFLTLSSNGMQEGSTCNQKHDSKRTCSLMGKKLETSCVPNHSVDLSRLIGPVCLCLHTSNTMRLKH